MSRDRWKSKFTLIILICKMVILFTCGRTRVWSKEKKNSENTLIQVQVTGVYSR